MMKLSVMIVAEMIVSMTLRNAQQWALQGMGVITITDFKPEGDSFHICQMKYWKLSDLFKVSNDIDRRCDLMELYQDIES